VKLKNSTNVTDYHIECNRLSHRRKENKYHIQKVKQASTLVTLGKKRKQTLIMKTLWPLILSKLIIFYLFLFF